MIKRTIEISREAVHLAVRLDQLILEREGQVVGSFPCEDVGLVLVEHPGTTFTHAALSRLAAQDVAVVVCGNDHLPVGMLLPVADHSQVVSRLRDQLRVKEPLRKQLWRQLVRAKILAQARNLSDGPPRARLRELARAVRSGDPNNSEAQAAKVYWAAWLGCCASPIGLGRGETFHRVPDGPPPNNLLNYGYAVMRAAVARALVGSGLLPALGLHHSHRANAFCLADDLMEPLRPLVDARVRELWRAGMRAIDQTAKTGLLGLLAEPVRLGEETGPLLVAIGRMTASLVACFRGESRQLRIPQAPAHRDRGDVSLPARPDQGDAGDSARPDQGDAAC